MSIPSLSNKFPDSNNTERQLIDAERNIVLLQRFIKELTRKGANFVIISQIEEALQETKKVCKNLRNRNKIFKTYLQTWLILEGKVSLCLASSIISMF